MTLRLLSFCGLFVVVSLSGCSSGSSSGGGGTVTPPVTPAATTTALAVSPNPAPAASTVTLVATVTSSSGTPTGSVTFYDGTTSLGTITLSSGVATLAVTTFAASSTHSLDATYSGAGSTFAASTSSAVSLTIQAAVQPITITATANLSFTTPNQTIAGFGAAEAFDLNDLDNHPNETAIMKALFDPVAGLGLTFLRVQNLYYQYTGTNGTQFDLDTPKIVTAANAAHGTPLQIEMSAWSPPASIKSNSSVNNGGTLNMVSGGYNYAGYAQFWYNSLQAYAALGVVPSYISLQNELDFTATYASCRFDPSEDSTYAGYDKALAAVYTQIQALTSPPKIIGPESFSTVNLLSYASVVEGEPLQSSEIYALGHHLYNVSSTSTNPAAPDTGLTALQNMATAYPTQNKWMTEYFDQPGFFTAWNMHNALAVGNDSAYFYWGLTWPSATVANGQATDQQGLIYIDSPFNAQSTWAFPSGWAYNDSYYAFKHFSYFVLPKYVRYNATITPTSNTDERVSVYQGTNPSTNRPTTVIVAMNVSTTVTDGLLLSAGTLPAYTSSAVYRSTFSQPITTGERWDNLGSYTSNGISMPPQSVVTIVLND